MTVIDIDTNRQNMEWVLAATALVVFPHVFHLPWQIVVFFYLLLGWRLVAAKQPNWLPSKSALVGLMAAAVLLVAGVNHGVIGRNAGTATLLVALGLKLMELRNRRDLYVVVFLAFFVALTQFLFDQNVFMAGYILLVCWALVGTLMRINAPTLPNAGVMKSAAMLIIQALPLMVVLFLLFPRLPTPRFDWLQETGQARSGLSDVLEPGAISRLSLSGAIAFRATFHGDIPPPADRYWRGPVFTNSDGRRWTVTQDPPANTNPIEYSGLAYDYVVVLEPHDQHWLFALDLPQQPPVDAYLSREWVLMAKSAIEKRRAYRLVSRSEYRTGPLDAEVERLSSQLPYPPSAQTRALLLRWRHEAKDVSALVQRALDYFREEPFVYTLTPPLLGEHPEEQFLFETRRGFCEHYATAFVYLMRALGIPARVVTGYQGGEFNGIGRFIEVRQADAHAWAEVWLEPHGWVRVDPTAAVAPERIEAPVDVGRQIDTGAVAYTLESPVGAWRLLKHARQIWSTIDHSWNRWVLGYDAQRQNRLFAWIGSGDTIRLVLVLAFSFTGIIGVTTLFVLQKQRPKQDKVVVCYHRFCRRLARRGLDRKPAEGACDFARRAAARFPQRRAEIEEITRLFLRLRYERRRRQGDQERIRRLVRQFRL